MEESTVKGLTTIELFQKWMSPKNLLETGSKFLIESNRRIITLIECEGYPKGKFVYENGEEFDITKITNERFVQIVKQKESIYNEKVWDELEKALNGEDFKINDEKRPIFYKVPSIQPKENNKEEIISYNVTDIVRKLLKEDTKENGSIECKTEDFKEFYQSFHNNSNSLLTTDKIKLLFRYATLEKFLGTYAMKVKVGDKDYGTIIFYKGDYYYVPNSFVLTNEYAFNDDQVLGFFQIADSYLDVALNTIKDYKKRFIPMQHFDGKYNKINYGYQASSTIKTLLAFSCECYLKALLMNEGMNITNIKDLGHSLFKLFTTLDDKIENEIINYMKKNDYVLYDREFDRDYLATEIVDRFMLDLTANDSAFEELRYSAEDRKNTNYGFLYKLALSLRECAVRKYLLASPFSRTIETNIEKNSK